MRALERRAHSVDESDAFKRVVDAVASLGHADNHLGSAFSVQRLGFRVDAVARLGHADNNPRERAKSAHTWAAGL